MNQDRGAGPAADGNAVYQISGARPGLTEDINGRTRRYIISMSIRTICFPIAVFTEGWVRWLFVAAAILLPYFAVIAANAGRERVDALPPTPELNSRLALPPGVGPIRSPEDMDGFLRATGERPPTGEHPEPTDWQRRASA